MQTFFQDFPHAGAGNAARSQALAHVQKNIKWLIQHKKTLEDWLGTV
jgi:glutamyl aminopeptidase